MTPRERVGPDVAARIGARRGGGASLAGPLRERLEQRLGPLPDVRLHTDPAAAALAADLDAVAFTSGRDVFFTAGAFEPGTAAGRALLSHELVHTLQQRDSTAPLVLDRDGGAQEHEARAGGPPHTQAAPGAVQRAPASHEREAALENPEGQVTWDERDHLILWNFDVGRSELKPPHRAAIAQLADTFRTAMIADEQAVLQIDGHASRSGGGELNESIALERGGSVAIELTERRISPDRLRLEGHGFQQPWVPNASGAVMARNRRVELRVRRFRTPPPPAPRPELRPPEPEEPVKEPVFRWDKDAPTTAFEIEIEIPAGSYPVGDFRVYPAGKFKFKCKVPTQHKDEVKLTLGAKGFKTTATKKLGEWAEVKVQETGGKLQIGFGLKFDLVSPEMALQPDLKEPLIIKIKTPPASFGKRDDIIPGLVVEGTVEFEGQFKIGPSERLLAKLAARFGIGGATAEGAAGGTAAGIGVGTAVAVGAGVIAINVAWLAWGFYQVEEAARRGRAWGATVNRRRGFAWRIAAEVVPEHFSSAFKAIDDAHGSPQYRELYEGWLAAQMAISRTPPKSPSLERLRKRHAGRWVLYVMDDIRLSIGGVGSSHDASPLPATLDEIP